MRLIDADAVVAMTATCPKEMDIDSFIEGMGVVLDRIYEAPTVDAVTVVRCEDCRFGEKGRIFDSDCIWCGAGSHQEAKSMRFYCASGERKEK